MSKVHVKTGDTVVLLTGKDIYQYKDVTDKSKGRLEGKVVAVSPKEGKVIVEGFNKITKHVKPTRIGHAVEDGKKLRVCKKCGKSFE